jgi:hypothetical protein
VSSSQTFSCCVSFYFYLRDRVPYLFQTTCIIIILYILINVNGFHSWQEDERLSTEWQQAFPKLILLLISSWVQFWFDVIPKYFNFAIYFCFGFILHSGDETPTYRFTYSVWVSVGRGKPDVFTLPQITGGVNMP